MNVTTLVFLGLAVVWAIVLLPELLRKLSGSRNSDTIRSFNRQLSVLDRTDPQRPARRHDNVIDLRRQADERRPTAQRRPAASQSSPALAPPMSVRKRRQEVLTVLGSAAVLTLLGAVAFGGTFLLTLHIVADVLLVTYVVLLTQVSQAGARQQATVAPGQRSRVDLPSAPARSAAPRRIAN